VLAGERHLRAKSGPVGSAISDVKKYRARQAVVPAAKHAVRNAGCGRRGAEGGVRAARSACWCSPLRRLAGRLISTRWGGEGGLLALAATKAGRPAYFRPMGRRGPSVHRSLHGRRGWHRCAGVEGPPGALKTPGGPHHPFGGAVFEEWGEVGTGGKVVPLLRRRRGCSRWEKWFLRTTLEARGYPERRGGAVGARATRRAPQDVRASSPRG
jgi:hypothetical protein